MKTTRVKVISCKISFDTVAWRLGIKREKMDDILKDMNIFEYSCDLPCPAFFVQEKYFIAADHFDAEQGYFLKLHFTQKGMQAFSKLIRKEGKKND